MLLWGERAGVLERVTYRWVRGMEMVGDTGWQSVE
jgi:hypothetical protein